MSHFAQRNYFRLIVRVTYQRYDFSQLLCKIFIIHDSDIFIINHAFNALHFWHLIITSLVPKYSMPFRHPKLDAAGLTYCHFIELFNHFAIGRYQLLTTDYACKHTHRACEHIPTFVRGARP